MEKDIGELFVIRRAEYKRGTGWNHADTNLQCGSSRERFASHPISHPCFKHFFFCSAPKDRSMTLFSLYSFFNN